MKSIIGAGLVLAFLSCGVKNGATTGTENSETEISNAQDTRLQDLINSGAFLVDARSTQEFANGHVEGSSNIPLDAINARLSEFKDKKDIVVYCQSGMRSAQALTILNENGFKNVTNAGSWETVKQLKVNK